MTYIAPPGLKGLIVADTEIGSVRGSEGFYHYRQYSAPALVRSHSLEDIWHLLCFGSFPEDSEVFRQCVASHRVLGAELSELLPKISSRAGSMHHALLASLPLVLPDARASLDLGPRELGRDLLKLVAAIPSLLAGLYRCKTGGAPIEASSHRSHASDWLFMLRGEEAAAREIRALEVYLSATLDHGMNASTFTTRVVASTGADAASALGAGVAALSGPLHGGAPGRVLDMLREIETPDRAATWVRGRLAQGHKIMGFGHAVYQTEDPRSALLKEAALGFDHPLVSNALAIEKVILETLALEKPAARIVTNVEYYAGVVLHLAGLDQEMFTPTFTVARSIGWMAHILEQAKNNKIMRPSARYIGPSPLNG